MTVDQFWFITKATLELPARLIDPEQRKEISGVVGSYETTRQTILNDLEPRSSGSSRSSRCRWRS